MKILFIEIDTEKTWAVASVGPAYIASYIRYYGHEADFLRVLPDQQIDDIICNIKKQSPDIIGFSLTTRQWKRADYIAKEIQKNINIPIIAGGLHPTFEPKLTIESECFDYVCIGEGEYAVCELLSCLEKEEKISSMQIPNIWIKGGDRPKIRPPIKTLDSIPFMARDFLDEKYGVIHINTQRGCPFPCTFCAAGAMRDLYKNETYIRRRTVNNVLEELCQIREKQSLNYVIFLDDTFTVNKEWVSEFCQFYGKEIGIGFSINARIETVTVDMIDKLAKAGCKHIVYGVESGSMKIRKNVLNRPVENKRFKDVFKWTKNANILVTANYMIGLPEETPDDIEQTIALNEELSPDDFGYFVFYPYPGTRLFHICQTQGLLPEDYLSLPANNRQSILNLKYLNNDDIERYYNIFTKMRERSYMSKYGKDFNKEDKLLISKSFKESADQG
ncbi:MAG: radical SAM protein [Desulfobacterales bacterium]|nr:radical SAM protein [Desulfobacterales bacterium]